MDVNVKKVARRNKYVITKINSKKCLVWKLQELQKITLFLSRGKFISKHLNETGDVIDACHTPKHHRDS